MLNKENFLIKKKLIKKILIIFNNNSKIYKQKSLKKQILIKIII